MFLLVNCMTYSLTEWWGRDPESSFFNTLLEKTLTQTKKNWKPKTKPTNQPNKQTKKPSPPSNHYKRKKTVLSRYTLKSVLWFLTSCYFFLRRKPWHIIKWNYAHNLWGLYVADIVLLPPVQIPTKLISKLKAHAWFVICVW